MPSVFIRTSGCNLRCVWCDTPYTSWAPEGSDIPLDEIVSRYQQYGSRHSVVTGGEPMMFPDTIELTRKLRAAGSHITIETAGTLFQSLECDLISISPKLANSTPVEREGGRWAAQHDRLRYQPEVLRKLISTYDYQLKFVIASPTDLEEANQMVATLEADPARVMLMPEGTDPASLAERGRWMVDLCLQHGYRYSPRLHVDLWGTERGR